ncbi:peptidoglycan DD-metalloendopeptidase family protein [Oleiphilus messinensis]|uniref:peptidoglycan DD-metalloendopeptidase family protein n=1 Tax=Oleiphilus messinensis TaxID=141451 RepID=UPI0018E02DB9|nr:peptidoglycan DD-metalloendopeptidase family protein [Oleiphilus messinensis]
MRESKLKPVQSLYTLPLLFSLNSFAGEVVESQCFANEFCVAVEQNDDTFDVTLQSLASYPLTVSVDFTLANLNSTNGESVAVVLPESETAFVTQLQINTGGSSSVDYSWDINFARLIGDATVSHDGEYRYQFPFNTGLTYSVLKGYTEELPLSSRYIVLFGLPEGSTVVAARNGRVVQVVDSNASNSGNNQILVEHDDGTIARYVNLQSGGALVAAGDTITRGQAIGLSGAATFNAEPYLYFATTSPVDGKSLKTYQLAFATSDGTSNNIETGDDVTSVDPDDGGTGDGGTGDGGTGDGGTGDGGTGDGGTGDGGTGDGGTGDGGTGDGGTGDGGTGDGGTGDGGTGDGGTGDGGTGDGGTGDGGTGDGGTGDGGTGDGGTGDGGTGDGGTGDGGTGDGGTGDGGTGDGGTGDGGTGDGGTGDGGTGDGGTNGEVIDPNTSSYRVQELYVAYYGRPGDYAGVNWWATELDNSAQGLVDIINTFGTSEEYEKRFGSLNTDELITNLYQQMFGREAEAAGLAWWTDEIESGRVTLAEAAMVIADGAQNEDLSILNNRTIVAIRITDGIEAQNKRYIFEDIEAAKVFIQGIDGELDPYAFDINSLLDTLVEK